MSPIEPTAIVVETTPSGEAAARLSVIPLHDNRLPCTAYRTSLKIDWSKIIQPREHGCSGGQRGRVGSMTVRSAQRLTFALANSPRPWGLMATLTFRERVMDGRTALAKFQRNLSHGCFTGVHYAWVREYQDRGSVHFHYLWDETVFALGEASQHWRVERVGCGAKARSVVRGTMEQAIVRAWILAVGDTSKEFLAFQRGGIVQRWEGENGAARYFGSYLGKEEQKELPADAEKCGRWWYVCPDATPVPEKRGFLSAYNREFPLSTVFDRSELFPYLVETLPTFIPRWGNKPAT